MLSARGCVCSTVLPAGPLMSTTPASRLCHLSLPPSLSLSAVAAIFTVHWASWLDGVRITFLLLCARDRYLSVAGSKSPKVFPFGSCMFLLWPLFQIQIAFQLPFVQCWGLWTGKRDREVSKVPEGQGIPIMSPSERRGGGETSEENKTVVLVHSEGRRSQGNTSTSTNLSVALTVSINLGGQGPL